MTPTETRVSVLEVGHRVLTDQQAEIMIAMAEAKECMREVIFRSVQDALPKTMPTAKQLQWLDLLIESEAKKASYRQAIIDKTLTALVWATIAGFGSVVWIVVKEFASNHGWKP